MSRACLQVAMPNEIHHHSEGGLPLNADRYQPQTAC